MSPRSDSSSDSDAYIPDLPPDLIAKRKTAKEAPTQPTLTAKPKTTDGVIKGPILPGQVQNNNDDSEDDAIVGPSVALANDSSMGVEDQAIEQFVSRQQNRLQSQKNQQSKDDEPNTGNKRGEWMLIAPEGSPSTSGNATSKLGIVFDKSWTETPQERQKRMEEQAKRALEEHEKNGGIEIEYVKKHHRRRGRGGDEGDEERKVVLSKEDQEKEKYIEEYNKRERPKSLLEQHLEKRNKGKKKSSRRHRSRSRSPRRDRDIDSRRSKHSSSSRRGNRGYSDDDSSDNDEWSRRRFNRDRDMAVSKVDMQRQRKMLAEIGDLKNKFASSHHQKFL
ncbi:hypothetical protein H4219_004765 [Mycoemilia scoparia]|uniref:DUF3752 domain-containing protein n=1 Tax=Mycoemilia scoparia TaxID=417184 RepID=A0A9W7ZQK0_9FUNG|nr:hypothetical protein H4219_004765 [Mycoemilia scoparia]